MQCKSKSSDSVRNAELRVRVTDTTRRDTTSKGRCKKKTGVASFLATCELAGPLCDWTGLKHGSAESQHSAQNDGVGRQDLVDVGTELALRHRTLAGFTRGAEQMQPTTGEHSQAQGSWSLRSHHGWATVTSLSHECNQLLALRISIRKAWRKEFMVLQMERGELDLAFVAILNGLGGRVWRGSIAGPRTRPRSLL